MFPIISPVVDRHPTQPLLTRQKSQQLSTEFTRKCICLLIMFKDTPCREIIRLTHWSSGKVCVLNTSLLFSLLLFELVKAIWEKSSLKETTVLIIHDCKQREEFNVLCLKTAEPALRWSPGFAGAQQNTVCAFCTIATNTNGQSLFARCVYATISYQFFIIFRSPTMRRKSLALPHTFLTASFSVSQRVLT